jgi:hypothetical protein
MNTISSIVGGIGTEARDIIVALLTANHSLSEAQAVKGCELAIDGWVEKLGLLGEIAEPFVNKLIEADVPAIYEEAVKDVLGTQTGGAVIVAQQTENPAPAAQQADPAPAVIATPAFEMTAQQLGRDLPA